jgi:heme/copper-type cytochrome/quinol oxidase subunit 3
MSSVPGEGALPAAHSAIPGEGRSPVAEEPAILAANLNVGVRLFSSAVAFVFVAFVFAFFYLRAVNSNGLWRPAHVNPASGIGIAMLVCVLGATGLFLFARRSLAAGARSAWLTGVSLAVVLGVGAVVIQVLQYTNYNFNPESGGYASVFVGWTAMFLFFWIGAIYWLETFVAQSLRPPPEAVESEITRPLGVMGPSADALVIYLSLLAGVEVVSFVLLYLIK